MSGGFAQPFQLLELNMISAQDLAKVSRKMKTYAVAWVHPDRKLATRIDYQSHNNPTWNDKFVFRVDDEFLYGETSAIMIEIYALHWLRHIHVGTVRVIVGNHISPTQLNRQRHIQLGMRFVALQVRRRSGTPQGILNIGVTILDTSKRSMPLYTQNSSAIGYRHLMGEKDPRMHNNNNGNKDDEKNSDTQSQFLLPWNPMPELRRIKSDTSSIINSDAVAKKITNKKKVGSMVNGSAYEKQSSKASSIITDSEITMKINKRNPDPNSSRAAYGALAMAKYRSDNSSGNNTKAIHKNRPGSSIDGSSSLKFNKFDLTKLNFGPPKRMNLNGDGSVITVSELGPSASEVAAAVERKRNRYEVEETESKVISSWSLESNMEGLESKLERWRTELPAAYDRSDLSSWSSVGANRYKRRSSQYGGGEAFSCFISACGVDFSIVCSGPSTKKQAGRLKRNPSLCGFSYL